MKSAIWCKRSRTTQIWRHVSVHWISVPFFQKSMNGKWNENSNLKVFRTEVVYNKELLCGKQFLTKKFCWWIRLGSPFDCGDSFGYLSNDVLIWIISQSHGNRARSLTPTFAANLAYNFYCLQWVWEYELVPSHRVARFNFEKFGHFLAIIYFSFVIVKWNLHKIFYLFLFYSCHCKFYSNTIGTVLQTCVVLKCGNYLALSVSWFYTCKCFC